MMEMERINDNTILIKIENRDLQERGMTVMDLFGNPQQIEAFFQEILEGCDLAGVTTWCAQIVLRLHYPVCEEAML